MTQAATAAVLRSGYLSHQGGPEDGLLAVDLSSDRVRAALFLLAGVQRGQPLGALLGYQLETALHDAYIQPLRNAYPLVAGKLTAGGGGDAGMSQVVDGLALDRARQAGLLPPGGDRGTGTPGLPGPGADQNALLAQFAALDDTVDAISDVGVAEAVYQTMRGNPDRAGAAFNGISQAEQLPDPQVVPTPRTGTDYTQRLCAVLAGSPALAAAWAGIAATPRAAAEPWLDAWVSALLPDPSAVSGTVSYTDGGTPVTAVVRLSDLAAALTGYAPDADGTALVPYDPLVPLEPHIERAGARDGGRGRRRAARRLPDRGDGARRRPGGTAGRLVVRAWRAGWWTAWR